jgi:hypothetical protein
MRSWHPPVQKQKKSCQNFKCRFSKKVLTTPHEKHHFLLGMVFLVKEIRNPILNFTWKTVCFLFTGRFNDAEVS